MMARLTALALALGALVARVGAQQPATRINVTAGDEFLAVEWAILSVGGDPAITGFTGEWRRSPCSS